MRLISFKCIGIGRIFQEENKIMRNLEHHKSVFYYIPLGVGFFCTIFFYHDNSTIVNILTLFLSIFIPIFISLLATLISFVMNKIKTRHNKERIQLLKETFYDICYLIPISVILLTLALFMSVTIFEDKTLYKGLIGNTTIGVNITWDYIYHGIIGLIFYTGIAHLIAHILMITKRIFVLFDKEIDLLRFSDNKDEEVSKDNKDYEEEG